jgi:predicted protein tyrosine phosphatase
VLRCAYGEEAIFRPDRLLRLRFHDAIERSPGAKLSTIDDVAAILAFGSRFGAGSQFLVHCHFGISRSTAAMAMLIARDNSLTGDEVFARLLRIRPRAWPNSLMVRHADDLMGRRHRLMPALGRLYCRQLRHVPDIAEFVRVHQNKKNRARVDCGAVPRAALDGGQQQQRAFPSVSRQRDGGTWVAFRASCSR